MPALLTGVSADLGAAAGSLTADVAPVSARPLTLAVWVYHTTTASNGYPLSLKAGAADFTPSITLYTASQKLLFGVLNSSGSDQLRQTTSSVISSGGWQHLAVTWASDGTVVLYVDGESAAFSGGTITLDPTGCARTTSGEAFASASYAMNGYVAHPAVWNVALAPEEIAALAAGSAPDAIATAPVWYVKDLSGDGPHSPEVGTGDLTENGTITDAPSDPPVYAPDPPAPPTTRTQHDLATSPTTLLASELNSLADDAYSAAGTAFDNATNRMIYADFELNVTFGSAPASDGQCKLYLCYAFDGTNYADGGGSVAPAETACVGVFPLRAVTTAQRVTLRGVVLRPALMKPVLRNEAGQTMPSSGATLKMTTYGDAVDAEPS